MQEDPSCGGDVTHRTVIASLLLLAVAGCGKSPEQQEAEKATAQIQQGADAVKQGVEQVARGAQQGSAQMAQGLQQMAQGLQTMAHNSGRVVDFEALKALLPEIDGWVKTDPRGEQVTLPVAMSRAEARYRKDDSSIELEITDTALSPLLLAPMSVFLSTGYSERSDAGFKRAAKVGGYPGFEEWNTDSRRGEVTVVVANRFIVQATGHDVQDLAAVRRVVESVGLAKLATLK
jgi:hypothetical protein